MRAEKERPLDDGQRALLVQSDSLVLRAMAELGAAYLQHREAEAAYKKAQAQLAACSAAALEAERQRDAALVALAAELGLPPGRWIFDAEQGTLVRSNDPQEG